MYFQDLLQNPEGSKGKEELSVECKTSNIYQWMRLLNLHKLYPIHESLREKYKDQRRSQNWFQR